MIAHEGIQDKIKRVMALTLAIVVAWVGMPGWVARAEDSCISITVSKNADKGTIEVFSEDVPVAAISDEGGVKQYSIEADKSYSVSITPTDGYHVVFTEGEERFSKNEETGAYTTIENITEACNISLGFVQDEVHEVYSINATVTNPTGGEVKVAEEGTEEWITATTSEVDGKTLYSFETKAEKNYVIKVVSGEGYKSIGLPEEFDDGEDGTYSYTVSGTGYEFGVDFIKYHQITMIPGENGKIVYYEAEKEGTEYTSSNLPTLEIPEVKEGEVVSFHFIPDTGYYVSEIKVNGSTLDTGFDGGILNEDESITYEAGTVTDNISVEASFTNIPEEKDEFANIGIQMIFGESTDVDSRIENKSGITYILTHGTDVTLTSIDGKRIGINGNRYESSFKISESITVNKVKVKGGWFGPAKYYELKKPVTFIIDNSAPSMQITSKTSTWLNGTEKNLSISGVADDAASGISKIVWFTEEKSEAEIIAESSNSVSAEKDGRFTIPIGDSPAESTTYYIYTVDKSKNISEGKTVEYKVDMDVPTITSIATNDVVENRGVYYSSKETIKVTVLAEDGDGAGLKAISLYVDGTCVETKETSNGTATFQITLSKTGNNKISAGASDSVGNVTLVDDYKKLLDGAGIVYDNTVPEIESSPGSKVYESEGIIYANADLKMNISVSDKISGLKSVLVKINDTVLTNDLNGKVINKNYDTEGDNKTIKESFLVSTNQVEKTTNNLSQMEITVTDITGQEYSKSHTIYIDTALPKITNIEVIENKQEDRNTMVENRGVYYSTVDTIGVSVSATDENGAGVKSISLYVDGTRVETKETTDGTATFQIALSKIGNNKISAMATDKVENKTAEENYGKLFNGAAIAYDDRVPGVSASPGSSVYVSEGIMYTNADLNMNISVSDEISGLKSVSVKINDTVITKDINGKIINKNYGTEGSSKTTMETFVVSTNQAERAANNRYKIQITATDITGQEYSKAYDIYVDTLLPNITKIEVEGALREGSGVFTKSSSIFGFYAKDPISAVITIEDAGDGSGIKSIQYYLENIDGTKTGVNTINMNKGPRESTQIKVPISPNFKGYIYMKAFDNVGNVDTVYSTTSGAIVESPETQNEAILLQPESTSKKDSVGHNLYERDTTVGVIVEDSFAGIRTVEWSVTAPYDTGNNTTGRLEIDNQGNLSDYNWQKVSSDRNLVTKLSYVIPVRNNSNNIEIKVKVTDRTGNVKEDSIIVSIDKIAPTIDITYNEAVADEVYHDFYSTPRTATLTVRERNFNPEDIVLNIQNTDNVIPQISNWNEQIDKGNPDNSIYTASIEFAADGDYTFTMDYHDLAGNTATTFEEQAFTIDQTLPVTQVELSGQATNGNYYAIARTATITITEHNFDPDRVTITGTATDNGSTIGFPATSGWRTNGDVHVAEIGFTIDGVYSFTVNGADKAGNSWEEYRVEEYCVDLTEPVIEISGVEDLSANNDVVRPVITFIDTNYDRNSVNIELVGANHGEVQVTGSFSNSENGQTFSFEDFTREKGVDDIYTLKATTIDMAGNSMEESIRFSVNRFGSVYVFDDSLKEITGSYIKEPIEVVLTETNVDELDENSIRITLSSNGTPMNLSEGTDYQITKAGGDGSWSQYQYKIDKELFAGDGKYIVSLYSKDHAGNVNENIDEVKQAEIEFGVDGTAPVIVPININSDESYNIPNKEVSVSVTDNLVLTDVKIKLNGETVEYQNNGDDYNFTIPESNKKQSVIIVASDAAGNIVSHELINILVSTNALIRWYNNTQLFAGTVAGAGVVVASGGMVFGFRRKNVIRIKKNK